MTLDCFHWGPLVLRESRVFRDIEAILVLLVPWVMMVAEVHKELRVCKEFKVSLVYKVSKEFRV